MPREADASGIRSNFVFSSALRHQTSGLNCSVPTLVRAAEKGDTETLVQLLDSGEDPNSADSFGLTSLHAASKKGRVQVVAELLHRRADPNVRADSLHGETPLHYACKYGHEALVKMLLASGACASVETTDGKTPIHQARSRGHHDVEAMLLVADLCNSEVRVELFTN